MFRTFRISSNLISQHRSFTVLSTDVCIFFSYFFCSLISVSKKKNIEKILNLPYLYNWKKFINKMNEKKKPGVSEYGDPEYVTREINIHILKFLLRQFYCLIFAPPWKSKYALVWKSVFPTTNKRYSSHLEMSILHRVAPIKVY